VLGEKGKHPRLDPLVTGEQAVIAALALMAAITSGSGSPFLVGVSK
jgi:hypothetical protein